jgi:hypothetical protein
MMTDFIFATINYFSEENLSRHSAGRRGGEARARSAHGTRAMTRAHAFGVARVRARGVRATKVGVDDDGFRARGTESPEPHVTSRFVARTLHKSHRRRDI